MWPAVAALSALIGIATIGWITIHDTKSNRNIAQALAAARLPAEPVLMLNNYLFDLPVHAQLTHPATVVEDWSNAELMRADSWRKELADAGRLAPAAAARHLIAPMALAGRLCTAAVSWVVGRTGSVEQYPWLAAARTVATGNGVSLWRVETRAPAQLKALACAGIPNAGSASM